MKETITGTAPESGRNGHNEGGLPDGLASLTPATPRLEQFAPVMKTSWGDAPTTQLPKIAAPAAIPRQAGDSEPSGTTLVLPYVGSRSAKRTNRLRAWMVTIPTDFAAVVTPLLWTIANWKGIIFTAIITVVIFAAGGLYRGRRHLSILDLMPGILGRLLIAAAIVAMIAAQRHESVEYVGEFMRTVAVSCALVITGRVMTTRLVLWARRRRLVEHGTIIVGSGPIATELARLIKRYPQYGLRFSGFVDTPSNRQAAANATLALGSICDLGQAMVATGSDVIIIADTTTEEIELMDLLRQPSMMRWDVWVVPRLCDFQSHSGSTDHIGAIPVTRLRRATLTGPKWALKRMFDFLFASLALIVVSPVLLMCAIAVRVEGGRGVIFRQQRIGRFGKPFDLLKFRSMKPATDHESRTNWSVANDPRVGLVGRFLRRTSLDELPQLWNIVRGDMTFVGPRPERPFFVDQFSAEHPSYVLRHRVPVGLTGLAQVSGLRGDTPISDRARFDNYYIDNWSLWLDIKVIARTFAEVFRGGGR
jgi:exopolysaccharide biosynthesis polyprenyl glycosylphosphotransferase